METGEINKDQRISHEIGCGACATVFHAIDQNDRVIVIKHYHESTINLALLTHSMECLQSSEWPMGVMPIISAKYEHHDAQRLTEIYVKSDGKPNSLQHRLSEHPNDKTWSLLQEIAAALAELHKRKVVHGNLKPGNIFFTNDDHALVTDWCLGRMPEVANLSYTDALLYAPPEQLLEPEGYFAGAGYRWDVFAFGVLSYRLLTGKFPRCEEIFSSVAPVCGETQRVGVLADIRLIAECLIEAPLLPWPDQAKDQEIAAFRDLITRCLNLSPAQRPLDMGEVHRTWIKITASHENVALLVDSDIPSPLPIAPPAQLAPSKWWQRVAFAIAIFSFLLIGASYFLYDHQQTLLEKANLRAQTIETERLDAEGKLRTTQSEFRDLYHQLLKEKETFQTQKNYQEGLLGKIHASQQDFDFLFKCVFEPIEDITSESDIRRMRLDALEQNRLEFLKNSGNDPSYDEDRFQLKLQLTEISLFKNDSKQAYQRLNDVIAAISPPEAHPKERFRIAANYLHLALLEQKQGSADAANRFIEARKALSQVPRDRSKYDRIKLLSVILNYREAQIFSAQGNHTKALEQLHDATNEMNQLAIAHPNAARLRIELSECFLASANVFENMNDLGNAREVRNLAVNELKKLITKNPTDVALKLDLCKTYTTLAHAAFIAGDTTSLEQHNKDAEVLLKEIIASEPHNQSAATKLAAHSYFRACIKEDTGDAAAALALANDGLKFLDFTANQEITDPLPHYYRALLLWLKGRLLGTNSQNQEVGMEKEAFEILSKIKENSLNPHLRKEHIQMNLAQILAELAHAYQRLKQNEEAKQHFIASEKEWQELAELHPENIDYKGQALWCRERIKGL